MYNVTHRHLFVLAAILFLFTSCAQNAEKTPPPNPITPAATGTDAPKPAATSATAISKSELTPTGPVGLFFMTRYAFGALEKSAWYFTPDGQAYENLLTGLTKEDLDAHKGRKGTLKRTGNEMEITWADGKKSKSAIEPDKTTFMWDMGIFSPVEPVKDAAAIAGSYEGGESLAHAGNAVMVSRSIELKADGTYSMDVAVSLSAQTQSTKLSKGASGNQAGTWKMDGYSMILTGDEADQRKLAFPFDDDKFKRLYLGGTLFKKK